MVLKVFVVDSKGYTDTYNDVYKINIEKVNNKNALILKFNPLKDDIVIPLNEIKLMFAVDNVNFVEYFRYEK